MSGTLWGFEPSLQAAIILIIRKPYAPDTQLIHRIPDVSSSFRVYLAGGLHAYIDMKSEQRTPQPFPLISMTSGTPHFRTTKSGWPLFQVSNEKTMRFMWWAFQTHPSGTS